MKEIRITKNQITIIDDEDYESLFTTSWYAHIKSKKFNTYYAARRIGGRRGHILFMHEQLIGIAPKGYIVDHINRDGLDNRKTNLRHATRRDNLFNSDSADKFRNIYITQSGKFMVQIKFDNKLHYLGSYNSALEATIVRDNFFYNAQRIKT